MAVFAQEVLDETGVVEYALLVAVVAVDEYHEVGGGERHLGALVVAGGGADATEGIAVDGQAGDVEHAATDAFVGLALAADAERQGVAHELVGIEAADAVAEGDAGQVDEVDEGVDLVEFLALQHTADKLFAGGTVTGGILAAGFVDAARGGNAWQFFQAFGGQLLSETLLKGVYLVPERAAQRCVDHRSLYGSPDESGAYAFDLS